MKRAVITGMGLVSPLGNNKIETLDSLIDLVSSFKRPTRKWGSGPMLLVALKST